MSIAILPASKAAELKYSPSGACTEHLQPFLEHLQPILERIQSSVAPVWPLRDYVAVNPYGGFSQRDFWDARAYLDTFSDCELLPSLEYFAEETHDGRLSRDHVRQAVAEMRPDMSESEIDETVRGLMTKLEAEHGLRSHGSSTAVPQGSGLKPLSEIVRDQTGCDWPHLIKQEIGKFCSTYYDQGQAAWRTPFRQETLYDSWRACAKHDLNPEVLGLRGFRALVSGLPNRSDLAVLQLLEVMQIPAEHWEQFLLCQVFSMPGWFALMRYNSQAHPDEAETVNEFIDLLAIRLAYESAVWAGHTLSPAGRRNLSSENGQGSALGRQTDEPWCSGVNPGIERYILLRARYILLRATELTFQDQLLSQMLPGAAAESAATGQAASSTMPQQRKLAQMVFCIDVRSERFRRQIEQCSGEVETFGFAGFFGVPMEVVPLGQSQGRSQLPVLLKPQFKVYEGLRCGTDDQSSLEDRLIAGRLGRTLWKSFATSAASCFTFVETSGLLFGAKLLGRAIGKRQAARHSPQDCAADSAVDRLGPTLRGLNAQGLTTSDQADLAAGILKNLGLTKGFARLVVFCGHESQTENNPLAASLDCGACGGHSGQANARFAATLLNQPYIRTALKQRGIEIPEDTRFLAAVHETTTDTCTFHDLAELPESHRQDVQELQSITLASSAQTREERSRASGIASTSDVFRRAQEWSEVRPEWGLAGNAAFVVAPRKLTKGLDLGGRVFLHSYESQTDPEGSVLELIMTAPMVVAHWINMQYYASSVDPKHFGSGSKTIHNVVGKFGLFSGEGGDLMTGLPWESVHTGQKFQHKPMRLLSVICASRQSIDRILRKHGFLVDLIRNRWLHLVCLDGESTFRCDGFESWTLIPAN